MASLASATPRRGGEKAFQIIMTSPAWLQQEAQSSTSQSPLSVPPSGVRTGALPYATTDPSSSVVSTPVSTPAFSYNVLPTGSTPGGPQHSSSHSVPNSNPPAASAVQPSIPGPSPSTGPSFSYNVSHTSTGFPGSQHLNSHTAMLPAAAQEIAPSSVAPFSQSAPLAAHAPSSTTVASTYNLGRTNQWMPPASSFPGISGTPRAPAPPGIVPPAPVALHLYGSSALMESPVASRPNMPNVSLPPTPAVQQQLYPPYVSLPHIASSPQGPWLQPPQIPGLPRPPFLPYPAAFPGPFPLPASGMHPPAVALPDSQHSGGISVGTTSGHQLASNSGLQPELSPPGIDNQRSEVLIKNGAAVTDQLDAWTAHKTDTGVVYYYNALTGVSTYEKPAGFKGEADRVTVQQTPVSWEKLVGTDWALVTTNDGKKYYYNTKTKLSSWQIPAEVSELRNSQDVGPPKDPKEPKDYSVPLPNNNALTEKVSSPVSLIAPAINTGGRDATALRASGGLGSASALDLIKKKLQESGTPVTSSSVAASSVPTTLESNGTRPVEATIKGLQIESSGDKLKDANGDGNLSESSSDSEDADNEPTREERIIQFKEMLKERGVAPFSKWEKELPKFVFDPRFKAIPGYSARRSLFDHYVKTRAEEERKEKRAAQKAAVEGFKQLLMEASEEIDYATDYYAFKKKWGHDPRFEALDRKEREVLLNDRLLPLKKAAEEKAQAIRTAAASSFKSMLKDKGDININTRWSKVKDSLRSDPRYKSVRHEDREVLFNEFIAEIKAAAEESERLARAKKEEQEKLKERERELRKRKEREEQEVERVRLKVRRKEGVATFQALLVETIKDCQASWTESKPKLEKDPQGRAINADLDPSDMEKLFREHIKTLHERCVNDFKALLSEALTAEAAARETEGGKTPLTSWSTAKHLVKPDPRYSRTPRKEREILWRRYAEEMQRKLKLADEDRRVETKGKTFESTRLPLGSRRTHERR